MRKVFENRLAIIGFLLVFASMLGLAPSTAWACACGCSVFDVGFGGLPQEDDHGGRVFFEMDHSNQTQNWVGTSKAELQPKYRQAP